MSTQLLTPLAAAGLLTVALIPVPALADDVRLETHAVLHVELASETDDGDLQKSDVVLEPAFKAEFDGVQVTGIGRIRWDGTDKLEPGRPQRSDSFRASWTQRQFAGSDVDLELRELYIDTNLGDTFLRLGKQQIVWGQADGLRVLDVINPFEFREFILGDFEDSRIPLWSAQVEVPIGDSTLQFIWLPDHSYDDIPDNGAAYEITSPRFVPQAPPGFAGTVIIDQPQRPNEAFKDDDVAVRWTAFLGGWDVSLNYFYGYHDQAVFFRSPAPGGIRLTPRYERTHLVGGTFANAFGDFTVRGELGYFSDRYYLTQDASDADGVFNTSEVSYVLGLDYLKGDWLISGQVFQSILNDQASGSVRDATDTSVSFLVERKFSNETIVARVLSLHNLNDHDSLFQVDLSYQWSTDLTLKVGADIFTGNAAGIYGQFDNNDRVTLGFELGF